MNQQQIFQDSESLFETAANLIVELANKAIVTRGKFTLVLSGGNTPEQLYTILSATPFLEKMPWQHTYIFWGDERCVPLNDKLNNAFNAKNSLLDKVPIPTKNIFRIPVNLEPAEAAKKYQETLNNFFESENSCFDLILLGLGENGHTASLFPNTTVIKDEIAEIKEVYVAEEKMFRITMTAPLINQARKILFLVVGEKKAEVLKNVLSNNYTPEKFPAQLINSKTSDVLWFTKTK